MIDRPIQEQAPVQQCRFHADFIGGQRFFLKGFELLPGECEIAVEAAAFEPATDAAIEQHGIRRLEVESDLAGKALIDRFVINDCGICRGRTEIDGRPRRRETVIVNPFGPAEKILVFV